MSPTACKWADLGRHREGLANVESLCSEEQQGDPDLSMCVEPPRLHLSVLPGCLEGWKL